MVPLNKLFQPVKKAGSIFNRFLSDVAKRPALCPINYKDWRLVPQYFKKKIITYIRANFLLLNSKKVDDKVLSSIGEKLRQYKRTLRMTYINDKTTKEELYNLPSAESGFENERTRPRGIGDAMWHEFVDLCFTDKFKKFSENGKMARAMVLHPQTSGSRTYAINRDMFFKEHGRDPGAIEFFIDTHEKKDGTFLEPITQQFVDTALEIVKKKTGQEVVFSKSTTNVENFTYKKLMGEATMGKVTGYGSRVSAKDLNNMHYPNESKLVTELMKTIHNLKNDVVKLKGKADEQASQHGSNCNSTEGLRLNGVSPTLRDANSVSNAEMPIERGLNPQVNETSTPLSSKQLLSIVGTTTPNRAQVARIQSNPIPQPSPLSHVKTSTTHRAQVARVQSNPVPQPSPLSRVETITSQGALAARIQSNPIQNMGPHDQGQAKRLKQNELTWPELEKVLDKVLKENPEPIRKFIRGDKTRKDMSLCFLAGMAMYESKKRANAEMLDKMLKFRLQKMEKQVAAREQIQPPQVINTSTEKQLYDGVA
ncbi:unnamed protein product [Amaranthus hypochondriacus]